MNDEEFIDFAIRHQEAYAESVQPVVLRQVLTEYLKTREGRRKIAASYARPTETMVDQLVRLHMNGNPCQASVRLSLLHAQLLLNFMSSVPESELGSEEYKTLWRLTGELEDWGKQCLALEAAKWPERQRFVNVLKAFVDKPVRTSWQRLGLEDEGPT